VPAARCDGSRAGRGKPKGSGVVANMEAVVADAAMEMPSAEGRDASDSQ
jgi:hypothetical protein